MQWSKQVCSVSGIPIRIHLSMLILAIWLLLGSSPEGSTRGSEALNLIFLFSSVCLHELGHALMAKKLGVRTKNITLYPFGGVALLIDKINAKQELLITIAGPLVNIVIAGSIIAFFGSEKVITPEFINSPLGNLLAINSMLAIFNSLPAFPMDGGRVLRASLQLLGFKSATRIATRCSQAICIALAILSLVYSHPILLIISIFVFYSASRELVVTDVQGNSAFLTAEQVMVPLKSLISFTPNFTLENAARSALRSLQSTFPICMESRVLGIVDKEMILQKACTSPEPQYITEIMQRELPSCRPETNLQELIECFEQNSSSALLVGDNENCYGIIFKEQLNDLLVVNELLRQNLAQREIEREMENF